MTNIASINLTSSGKLYNQDFDAADDTTKYYTTPDHLVWSLVTGAPGVASYIRVGIGATTDQSAAAKNVGVANMVVFVNTRTSTWNASTWLGAAVRLTDGTHFYHAYIDSSPKLYLAKWNTTQTGLANVAIGAVSDNTWYDLQLSVVGSSLKASCKIGATAYNVSATDTALATGNLGGAFAQLYTPSTTSDFNIIVITTGSTITINGLLAGQKFKVYKGGVLVGTSIAATGSSAATLEMFGLYPNPPYDQIIITDIDGSTLLGGLGNYVNTGNIYPGDVYTVLVTTSPVVTPPRIMPPHRNIAKIALITTKRTYNKLVAVPQISPQAAGTLGVFRVVIPDPTGEEKNYFNDNEPCIIMGKLGLVFDKIMVGIVDTKTPDRIAGRSVLEVAGRSWGAWAAIRGYSTRVNFTGVNAYTMIMDATTGAKTLVPELEFGNYVFAPSKNVSYETILPGRKVNDALDEFAGLSSTINENWIYYDCKQEHLGESKPNQHFTPAGKTISLIPFINMKGFKVLAPEDSRQMVNRALVHYAYSTAYDATDTVTIDSALTLLTMNTPTLVSGAATIVQDAHVTQNGNGNISFTHAANALVTLFTNVDLADYSDVTAVTIGGVSMTKEGQAVNAGRESCTLWRAFRASAGTETIVFTGGGAQQENLVVSHTGGVTSAPFLENVTTATGGSSSTTVTIAAGTTGRRVIAGAAVNTTNLTTVPTMVAGQTQIDNVGQGGGGVVNGHAALDEYTDTAASQAMTSTFSGATSPQWATVGGAILPGAITPYFTVPYLYVDLTNVSDYTIQSGDVLEYDVLWMNKHDNTYFDIETAAGVTESLRGITSCLDQSGIRAGTNNDVSMAIMANYCYRRWYHRRIPIPSSLVGKTITKFMVACDDRVDSGSFAGAHTGGFRNIMITDGGITVRKTIYDGDTAAVTTSVAYSLSATLTSLVGGDPLYGVIPKIYEKVWMTQGQAKDFGKQVCNLFGKASVKFLQGTIPPNLLLQQGMIIPYFDRNRWGKGRLVDVKFINLDRPMMSVTLMIEDATQTV